MDPPDYREVMRWLRGPAAVAGVIGAWLGLFALGIGLTVVLMVLPLMATEGLYDDRSIARHGRHGNLIVQRCDGPESGEWTCVGRFVSDDTEMTVENVTVRAEDRPGELVAGWVNGPYATELVTELTLVPEWILTGVVLLAFLIYTAGMWASVIVSGKLSKRAWRRLVRRA